VLPNFIKQTISTESEIESIFKRKGKSSIGFRKSFCENLQTQNKPVQVIADATDPNIANTITNYVNAILQNRAQEINKANLPAYQIQTQTQLYYNPELKVFYLVPGVMTVILMLVSAMMTSISITREKNWVPWKYCSSPL
jgi:ABC-2 type transport system permease protein